MTWFETFDKALDIIETVITSMTLVVLQYIVDEKKAKNQQKRAAIADAAAKAAEERRLRGEEDAKFQLLAFILKPRIEKASQTIYPKSYRKSITA
ncbi:hypothetical protein M7I_2399 [Glarea lozoyensis 74030]|uniref:Uncharacterized protein n=1 Tax=Glarea lozoyensis (strain ATCC 74030 / MF5533) TaxID=1104152 RepID=H0EIN9_GLAL7|nr:hypothetical protein M7I_2399 [Glarea lozoyensis 74030]